MFALLVKTNQLSEYLGSVGVEGGQGDADNLFGSHDDHGQLGVASGAGDIDDKYFSTGDIYVSIFYFVSPSDALFSATVLSPSCLAASCPRSSKCLEEGAICRAVSVCEALPTEVCCMSRIRK